MDTRIGRRTAAVALGALLLADAGGGLPRAAAQATLGAVALSGGPKAVLAPAAAEAQARPRPGLSHWVLRRAYLVGREINRTGGYRFDGYNDCYGFIQRVWNPILKFYKRGPLPKNDYPDRLWQPIRDWNLLRPGDVLSTDQGHFGGASWHGALYYGKRSGRFYVYDNSGHSDRGGAYIRPRPYPTFMRYYYVPTHRLLIKYRRG